MYIIEEAHDFKSFKEELFKTKLEKRKKKVQKHINKKRGLLNKEKNRKLKKRLKI